MRKSMAVIDSGVLVMGPEAALRHLPVALGMPHRGLR